MPLLGRTAVTPVIASLSPSPLDPSALKLSAAEVSSVFLKPLSELSAPDACRYTQFRTPKGGYTLPVYDVGPHRVWGMTAVVTYQFLSLFLGRGRYKHRLNFQKQMAKS